MEKRRVQTSNNRFARRADFGETKGNEEGPWKSPFELDLGNRLSCHTAYWTCSQLGACSSTAMKNLVLFLCFSSLALAHPGHDAPTPEEIEPQTRKLSPLSLSITGEMGKDVKVKVIRNGRAETLDLQVYNCRSKNFKVLGTTDEGGLEEIKAPPVCTYRGTIKDDPGSEVAGVITPEGVRMRVQCSNGECWQIDNTGGYHQWYPLTLQDRKHELEEICRVLENPSLLTTAFAVPREVTVKQAEIGFDIDYPTWSRSNSGGFNGNDAAAIARMEEFVAVKLNSFVISNALVEHVVGTIVIRKSAAQDPYDGMTNSSTILSHMRDVWNGWNNTGFPRPSTTHHLATALIGRSMGGIAGLGYVGTINENSRYEASELVGFKFHRGCLAIARKPPNPALSKFGPGIMVVLPEIADPGNLGTIIRNTAALGGSGVIIGRGASPFNAKAVRASAGNLFEIPVRLSPDLKDDLEALSKTHTLIGASLASDAISLRQLPELQRPAALLLGPEDFGLTKEVEARCHHLAYIPMSREIDSLNVASASAIFLESLR